MDFKKAKEIFNLLYKDINGYQVSLQARKRLSYYDQSLTYGEINFDTFFQMLQFVNPKSEDIFYDLGSGTGKAVFAAHLLFDFKKSLGIEILPDLHQATFFLKEKYEKEIKPNLVDEIKGEVEFVLGDFLKINFFDGRIIFANSTCFSQELMNNLETMFLNLKKGTKIITLTKTLVSKDFRLLDSKKFKQSWGDATVNFYERV